MRVLSLDIGSRKIGLAISSVERNIISPLPLFRFKEKFNGTEFWDLLKTSLSSYWSEIDSVVIGDGKDSYFYNQIERVIDQVYRILRSRTNWKIYLVSEINSSVESREFLKKINYSYSDMLKKIDSYAALFLLKDFLDRNQNKVLVSF